MVVPVEVAVAVRPRMVLILSENWTMTSGRDMGTLVRWAREAEAEGFDAVMVSEHIVLGPDAGAAGLMANPRMYALPGNQDPATPWPSSLVLLSAIAAVTSTIRLVAGAVLAPLRHPLLLARELGTLDLLSGGRLVVLPSVSWSRDEYRALGVPFECRGDILDEQLAVWHRVYAGSPTSFHGKYFSFDDVHLEPAAFRPAGPTLWFGGQKLHRRLRERLVHYGAGWNPLGAPAPGELAALHAAMREAGRDPGELELIGGTRAIFPDATSVADLDQAMAALPEQMAQGYTTFCLKPSQFTDDPNGVAAVCRRAVRLADEMGADSRLDRRR